MERGALKPRRLRLFAAAALGLVIVLVAGLLARARYSAAIPAVQPSSVASARVVAPEGVRIRVEVLNATRTRGLGRRATRWLRDGGFDVVYTGTSRKPRDSTVVIGRSGHPEWARLVADRLGGARVEMRPDSSRYLDVTVFLGSSFRPPAQALHP